MKRLLRGKSPPPRAESNIFSNVKGCKKMHLKKKIANFKQTVAPYSYVYTVTSVCMYTYIYTPKYNDLNN